MPRLSEWRVVKETPTKRILMRYVASTDEVEICEEWLEDAPLAAAKQQREAPTLAHKDTKPLAVIPDSVMSRAIREGWVNDQHAWAKWSRDIDNRNLRTS